MIENLLDKIMNFLDRKEMEEKMQIFSLFAPFAFEGFRSILARYFPKKIYKKLDNPRISAKTKTIKIGNRKFPGQHETLINENNMKLRHELVYVLQHKVRASSHSLTKTGDYSSRCIYLTANNFRNPAECLITQISINFDRFRSEIDFIVRGAITIENDNVLGFVRS